MTVSLTEKKVLLFIQFLQVFCDHHIVLLLNQEESHIIESTKNIIGSIRMYIRDGKRRVVYLNKADTSFSLILKRPN